MAFTEALLVHEGFFYRDLDEYVRGVGNFVQAGLDADEAVMVAVPGAKVDLLRAELDPGGRVQFANMMEVGQNPARIIPRIRAFIDQHAGRRVRFVGEPIWAGRSPSETVEGTRHEALINLAFADAQAAIFCPYDLAGLDEDVLADAHCTHPILVEGADRWQSDSYTDPVVVYAAAERPLPEPPASASVHPIGADLVELRAFIRDETARAGLDGERAEDLLLATHEAMSNTLVHVGPPGTLEIWEDGGELICEVSDGGHIRDPLVGRVVPTDEHTSGRGIWLINQLCDLVELRSNHDGTVVRLHMRLNPAA